MVTEGRRLLRGDDVARVVARRRRRGGDETEDEETTRGVSLALERPAAARPRDMVTLQRWAGNRATSSLLAQLKAPRSRAEAAPPRAPGAAALPARPAPVGHPGTSAAHAEAPSVTESVRSVQRAPAGAPPTSDAPRDTPAPGSPEEAEVFRRHEAYAREAVESAFFIKGKLDEWHYSEADRRAVLAVLQKWASIPNPPFASRGRDSHYLTRIFRELMDLNKNVGLITTQRISYYTILFTKFDKTGEIRELRQQRASTFADPSTREVGLANIPWALGGSAKAVKGYGKGLVKGAWSGVKGLYQMVRHPIQTAKGVYYLFARWDQTKAHLAAAWKELASAAGDDPERFGELIGKLTGEIEVQIATGGAAKAAWARVGPRVGTTVKALVGRARRAAEGKAVRGTAEARARGPSALAGAPGRRGVALAKQVTPDWLSGFLERLFGQKPGSWRGQVHLYEDERIFLAAYKAAGGKGRNARAFYDTLTKEIHIGPKVTNLSGAVHEALHKVADAANPRFVQVLGKFLSEGMVESIASELMGRAFIAPYPEAFAFARLLAAKVGKTVVERAVLLGDVAGLKAALAGAIGAENAELLLSLARTLGKGGGGGFGEFVKARKIWGKRFPAKKTWRGGMRRDILGWMMDVLHLGKP